MGNILLNLRNAPLKTSLTPLLMGAQLGLLLICLSAILLAGYSVVQDFRFERQSRQDFGFNIGPVSHGDGASSHAHTVEVLGIAMLSRTVLYGAACFLTIVAFVLLARERQPKLQLLIVLCLTAVVGLGITGWLCSMQIAEVAAGPNFFKWHLPLFAALCVFTGAVSLSLRGRPPTTSLLVPMLLLQSCHAALLTWLSFSRGNGWWVDVIK